jgi:holin-like protein
MIGGLTALLLFQLAGEVTARGLGLPVPGPVLGMVYLFLFLFLRERRTGKTVPQGLRQTAEGLLSHLGLLFVPAGVGVINGLAVLAANGVVIAVAIGVSTALALIVTAFTMQALDRPGMAGAGKAAGDAGEGGGEAR